MVNMPPTFVEVCAGCGGLSTGMIEAGFKPLHISDIKQYCVESLQTNHTQYSSIVHKSDMRNVSLNAFESKVDVLCGGVPCQAFSLAGERRGLDDPRGQLIVEFNRLILECVPKIFFVENVRGLQSHNGGNTLKNILELFSNNGKYNVSSFVVNAWDYEVPQKRERIIIYGIRNDIDHTKFVIPPRVASKPVLRDILMDVPESEGAQYPEKKYNVLRLVPPGGCWVDLPHEVQLEYMGNSIGSGGGKRGIARRLSMDEPSLTLLTSPQQKQTERCHPTETRPFNVREYARIQTFPDSYIFHGSMMKKYEQIGNAVPVKLAFHIGKAFLKLLSKRSKKSSLPDASA